MDETRVVQTKAGARERARCPYCGKRVTLTKTGRLWAHLDPQTKRRCGRSGGRPS